MAITKLLRLKECSRGNKAQHLKNNIRYILNPEKTQGGLNIGGNAGVTWDWVYETMVENKRYWHKEDGSQGFHYVISFPPEADVSIQTAHEVAQEFCSELLGENYYYVYAIHDDKPHLHIHVTFDSVSRLTGLKYHSPHGDWEKRIQPITTAVCKKFGLPPLTYGEERVGAPYETWRENKERQNGEKADLNRVSWSDIIRDDIDEAVRNSDSYASFLSYLQAMHYQVRDGKYLSLKPYGKPKAVRTRSLGPGYGREELIARIKTAKTMPFLSLTLQFSALSHKYLPEQVCSLSIYSSPDHVTPCITFFKIFVSGIDQTLGEVGVLCEFFMDDFPHHFHFYTLPVRP